MVIVSLALSFLIFIGAILLRVKSENSMEKRSPFECGFSPQKKNSNQFSLQFFLVTLIFLIFDVELILLFPFVTISHNFALTNLLVFYSFLLILRGGFIWEWRQKQLDWRDYWRKLESILLLTRRRVTSKLGLTLLQLSKPSIKLKTFIRISNP